MWQKMGIAPMQLRGCDLRQAAACRHDAPLQFRSRLHGSEKTLLIRRVCGIRRRLGFALVRYLRIGFVGASDALSLGENSLPHVGVQNTRAKCGRFSTVLLAIMSA